MCEAPVPGDSVALIGGVLHIIGFLLASTGFVWTWQYAKKKGKKTAHIDRFFVTMPVAVPRNTRLQRRKRCVAQLRPGFLTVAESFA